MIHLLRLLSGCAMLFFGMFLVAEAGPAKTKAATTPEQAVEFFLAGVKAGDREAAFAQLASPWGDLCLGIYLGEETQDILKAALDEKFGKKPNKGFTLGVKREITMLKNIEILSKDAKGQGKVKLNVRETIPGIIIYPGTDKKSVDHRETHYFAVQEGERWKLLMAFSILRFGMAKDEKVTRKGPDGKDMVVLKETFQIMKGEPTKTGEIKPIEVAVDLLAALKQFLDQPFLKGKTKDLPAQLAKLKRHPEVARDIAAAIRADKYQSREEASKAFQAAIAKIDGEK